MNTAEMCLLNVIIIYFQGLGVVHSPSHCHGGGNRELEPNGAIVNAIRNCLSAVPVMLW